MKAKAVRPRALPAGRLNRWMSVVLSIVISFVVAVSGAAGVPQSAAASEQPLTASVKAAEPIGSYEVAPVRNLGVPAISVSSPVVSQQDAGPQA